METAKGKYEREEIFGEDLQRMFGERYQDATIEPVQETEGSTDSTFGAWTRAKALAGLILGDGLLLYMLMSGKIDDLFGVLFVAGVSAACGYYLR